MANLNITDVRVFVPARDFALSKRFYAALGWAMTDIGNGGLTLMELGGHRHYLQDFYLKDWAENFVIFVAVEDARAWFEHASAVLADGTFGDARITEPKQEPWGALTSYAFDPSGVLIHFAQWTQSRRDGQ
jgi:predicted enzyme related to lactoylglutathione lyase